MASSQCSSAILVQIFAACIHVFLKLTCLKFKSGTSLLFNKESEKRLQKLSRGKKLSSLMRNAINGPDEDHFHPFPAADLFLADKPRSGDN